MHFSHLVGPFWAYSLSFIYQVYLQNGPGIPASAFQSIPQAQHLGILHQESQFSKESSSRLLGLLVGAWLVAQ